MMERISGWYWMRTYHLRCWIKSIKCFFQGHDIKWGCRENYELDWCDYCWKADPQDMLIFRDYMNTVFVRIIERLDRINPEFRDKLLGWKPLRHMPDWWEY
jgi:hypothetical protein